MQKSIHYSVEGSIYTYWVHSDGTVTIYKDGEVRSDHISQRYGDAAWRKVLWL